MRNSILYRKIIFQTLIVAVLIFCVEGICIGQLSITPDVVKDGSTQFVVWIVTKDGTGSGVLINKNRRYVVTNDHVTGENKEVQVFFAVRDSSGDIVRARPFYGSTDHQNTLERLGYVTRGRVIAKYNHLENEPDLAIIELDGLPGSAVPRKLPLSIDYSRIEGKPVHILGHPDERPLWHWKAGFFKEEMNSDLHIYADAYFGNSGGPVLNMDGSLIGIARAINQDKGITFAVPTSSIIDLYKTFEGVKIFSIYNNTEQPISYNIQWNEDEDENWKEEEPLEPKRERLHSLLSKDIPTGYPKIQYKDSQNSEESSENEQELETKSRYFGIGIKDVGDLNDHIEINDALRYQFMADPETEKISLVKMKLVQTFMIHNNTKASLFFYYRWHEDEKWTEEYIKSNEKWRYGQPSERVSPGYPVIRFDKIQGDREYPERNRSSITLLTQTGYFDKTTKIKEDIEQIGGNPPLYYQFKNNVETKGISLEELKRTQRFIINNPTDVRILFQYKWRENDKWTLDIIDPKHLKFYDKQYEIAPSDSAKINYSKNVIETEDSTKIRSNIVVSEDNKSAENIQKIGTRIGYSNKNSEFIPDQYQFLPFEYHFKYNSKAKKLSLNEGLQNIPQKSKGWSFSILGRSFSMLDVLLSILIVVLAVLVVNTYFPKRPVFIIHNNTKSNMSFQVKWEEDEDWDMVDPLEPDDYTIEWNVASPKEIPQGYPKVRFESIVNDKKETTEQTLKFDTRRFWHKSEPKTSSDSNKQYYFEFNPETSMLNLVDSESSDA